MKASGSITKDDDCGLEKQFACPCDLICIGSLAKTYTYASPKQTIQFCDGSMHEVGKYYEITPDTRSYFIVNQKYYHFSSIRE